jgi:hypothetical protein
MNKYRITFRSGIWSWRSEEEVQEAKTFTEAVTACQHATWTFADAEAAAQETATFHIPESQQQDGLPTSSELVSDTVVLSSSRPERQLDRTQRRPLLSHPARACKATTDTRGTIRHDKWKCMQTKVATFNGINDRFPALQRDRTGWIEGTLCAMMGNRRHPTIFYGTSTQRYPAT